MSTCCFPDRCTCGSHHRPTARLTRQPVTVSSQQPERSASPRWHVSHMFIGSAAGGCRSGPGSNCSGDTIKHCDPPDGTATAAAVSSEDSDLHRAATAGSLASGRRSPAHTTSLTIFARLSPQPSRCQGCSRRRASTHSRLARSSTQTSHQTLISPLLGARCRRCRSSQTALAFR